MGVILPVLNNDIDTVPTKFQMVSIYVTSGMEQSSKQAITVPVDFHDTLRPWNMGWGVLNSGSVEKDGVLNAGFDVALICIGACMGDGREDENGGGAGLREGVGA
jgi:hypothetical protein